MARSTREGSPLACLSMLAVMALTCCTCSQAFAFTFAFDLSAFNKFVKVATADSSTEKAADDDPDDGNPDDPIVDIATTEIPFELGDDPTNPGENRPGTLRLAMYRTLDLFAAREIGLITSYDQPISQGRLEVEMRDTNEYINVDFNSLHSLNIDATNGTAVLFSDTKLGDTVNFTGSLGNFGSTTRRGLLLTFDEVVATGDPLNSFTGRLTNVLVMAQTVPEPMSLAMWSVVAVGGLAVALRKRRQAAGG